MSFLDNLENNLKSLENANDRDSGRERERRESERKEALASAPAAEELKRSPFTHELLTHAVRIGHTQRTKVNMVWLGSMLRLEAKEKRLELRPTPDGVQAVFLQDGEEQGSEMIVLSGDAQALASRWLLE
jgi:hypothetical protein